MNENKMGCLQTKSPSNSNQNTTSGGKTYSWDTRDKVNPEDYTIENVNGKEDGRMPGTINGQQFIIQNCHNSRIYLFDHINTVTIDDCSSCIFFIGPTSASLFIRDSSDCIVLAACGQFRTRDCRKLDVYLHCQTQPIIEASIKIRFGCFQAYYPELEEQYSKSTISIFNNNWANIHDFTPVDGENNWTKLNHTNPNFQVPKTEPFSNVGLSCDEYDSIVPYTLGSPNYASEEAALVVFFHDESCQQRVKSFIASLRAESVNFRIQHTREITMDATDSERVFQTSSLKAMVIKGPIIALLLTGNGIQAASKKHYRGPNRAIAWDESSQNNLRRKNQRKKLPSHQVIGKPFLSQVFKPLRNFD